MTSETPSLSWGCLQNILDGVCENSVTLQILGYKRVPGEGDRFRLLLNDGKSLFSFAILATPLNYLISSKKLEKYSVFMLNKYVCTEAPGGKKIIICVDITPIKDGSCINSQLSCCTTGNIEIISKPQNEQDKRNITNKPTEMASTSKENDSVLSKLNVCNVQTASFATCSNVSPSFKGVGISDENKNLTRITSSLENKFDKVPDSSLFSKAIEIESIRNLPTSANAQQSSEIPSSISTIQCYDKWPIESINASPLKKSSVVPISCLTPYQNRWIIKARVVYKSHLIDYSTVKKEGKIFSFLLIDDSEMEIRATAFDKQAEELDNFIQLNKIYFLSNASVVLAKRGSLSKNEFEININSNTKIEVLSDDDGSIPGLTFNFIPLDQLSEKINDFVDVIVICTDVSLLESVVIKSTNRESQKLNFTIVDSTKIPIFVTLWGRDAEKFKISTESVIAIKNAKVNFFKIRCSLNVSSYSMLFIDPVLNEAQLLKTWFKNHRQTIIINSNSLGLERMSGWKYLSEINIEDFSPIPDKVDYYTVKATIIMIQKENCMYKACPSDECFKKVIETPNSLYHCSKCNKDYDSFSWTLMLNLNVADFSSDVWAVAFRETAETILSFKTEALSTIKEQDEDMFLDTLSQFHFKSFIFKMRSRIECYNDTNRLKTAIIDVEPINPISYSKKLLVDINHMEKILYERA